MKLRKLNSPSREILHRARSREDAACNNNVLLSPSSLEVPQDPNQALIESIESRKKSEKPSVSFGDTVFRSGRSSETYVKVNIGGKSFCVRTELWTEQRTLMHTFVQANHASRCQIADDYLAETDEYYFERNSKVVDHVMDFFNTGSLHRPSSVCAERYNEELRFWRIQTDEISPCCSTKKAVAAPKKFEPVPDDYETEFDGVPFSNFRRRLWCLMEDPQSSVPAGVFALLSVFFVFSSVFGLILGSMPEFQHDNSNASAYHNMHNRPKSTFEGGGKFGQTSFERNEDFPDFLYKPTDDPNTFLVVLEYVCIGWFTFEYITRLLLYPLRKDFVLRTLNLIDLMTILPFYLEVALPLFGVYASKFKEITGALLVIRILRVLRMARVFKLARYSSSLQTFGHTLRSSMTELSMLSMFLVTGIIFFSTVMYYLEKDEPFSDFYSIPAGCWWCVVTMATVGYGDAKPVTTCGKLVATATSICGIIVLAFPISMIVEKFASAQQRSIQEMQMQQARMSAVANNCLLKRFPTRRRACRDPLARREPLTTHGLSSSHV